MVKILSCLKKRDLLHSPNTSPEELSQYGREYLQANRLVDALDFFEKAQDQEGIRQVKKIGLEEGDFFLLQQSSKLLKEPVPDEVWKDLGERFLSQGKLQEALSAFKVVEDEAKIQEIQALLQVPRHDEQQ
jgi:tetratricopeptide (TPR) repeat protein